MSSNPQAQSFLIAVGLVIVGIFGVVVVWKITKSLFKLAFWLAALAAVALLAWWLLAKEGVLPPSPLWNEPRHHTTPVADPLTA